jgi:hypothetical protein
MRRLARQHEQHAAGLRQQGENALGRPLYYCRKMIDDPKGPLIAKRNQQLIGRPVTKLFHVIPRDFFPVTHPGSAISKGASSG